MVLSLVLLVFLARAEAADANPQEVAASQPVAISGAARARITERCRAYLAGLHAERKFPGCVGAVVLPDAQVLSFPIGLADLDRKRPMAAGDRMLSGSVGKTYVSAAAHKLMLAGRLDWDQKAIRYLADEDWFRRIPNAETMTLRHLLRHQSGIARHVFKPSFFRDCYAEPDRVWRPRELLAYVFDDEPLFPAGSDWAYADTNYIVLGMIIEKVTGRTFYDYVREEFLAPLGLRETVPSDSRRIPGLVQGHIVLFKTAQVPARTLADGVFFYNPQFEWCGGGYASSAGDLARWAHLLYSGRAMEGDYLSSMLDAVPAKLGPNKRYGLGVMVSSTDLGPALGHDGVMTGYGATVSYFPDHRIAAALQMNTDDVRVMGVPLDRVTLELARIVVDELARAG